MQIFRLIIFLLLFIRVSDEQCVMIMSVRKGKRLISRLLAFLPSPQATAIVMAISRNLPALAKKDKQDQVTHKSRQFQGKHQFLTEAICLSVFWHLFIYSHYVGDVGIHSSVCQ